MLCRNIYTYLHEEILADWIRNGFQVKQHVKVSDDNYPIDTIRLICHLNLHFVEIFNPFDRHGTQVRSLYGNQCCTNKETDSTPCNRACGINGKLTQLVLTLYFLDLTLHDCTYNRMICIGVHSINHNLKLNNHISHYKIGPRVPYWRNLLKHELT